MRSYDSRASSPNEKMPWFMQHHADRVRRRLRARTRARTSLGEVEPRHHVRDHDDRLAVDLAHARFAVRGVGDREHRVGVGVVDEPVRQERVQDRLDRGRRRATRAACG